jgi:inosine-uridine nucleoside N-ribohydrolase
MTTKITLPAFIKSITKNYVNKEISVIAIGPLTNIAKALDNNRSFANSIGEICIMGGA